MTFAKFSQLLPSKYETYIVSAGCSGTKVCNCVEKIRAMKKAIGHQKNYWKGEEKEWNTNL